MKPTMYIKGSSNAWLMALVALMFLGRSPLLAANNFLDFDGSDDYVYVGNPSALQITGNLTIEMWLKPDNFSARRNPYNKAYGGEGTITQETNGALNFYYGQSGTNASPYQGFNSSSALTLGVWNHIAIVRDLSAGMLYWYINGNLTNSTAAAYNPAVAGNNDALIGNGYTNVYDGGIDELRIWNVARTQSQIQSAMNYELSGSETGLVAYYNFNQGTCGGNNSGTTMLAALGNGAGEVDGTLTNFGLNGCSSNFVCTTCGFPSNNVSTTDQVFMDFDGSGDYIDLGNPPQLQITGNQTIEMWLKPDDVASSRKNPYAKSYGGEGTITQEPNGSLSYYYGTGGNNSSPYIGFGSPANTVTVGTWTHVALVRDVAAGTLKWYKNGALVASGSAPYNPSATSSLHAYIGAGYVSNYDGQIDEVRIWNVARTQTEIQSAMNTELIGNETGLVAYYPFREGVCGGNNTAIGTVLDKTSNHLNGTVVGFSRTGCSSNWVCESCDYTANNVAAAVPTLSQWGIIILILLVLSFESAVIWNRKYRSRVVRT